MSNHIVPSEDKSLTRSSSELLARRGLHILDKLQQTPLTLQPADTVRSFSGIGDRSIITFSKNKRFALIANYGMCRGPKNSNIVRWEVETGQETWLFPNRRHSRFLPSRLYMIYSTALSDDGTKIFIGHVYGGIHCWDLLSINELFHVNVNLRMGIRSLEILDGFNHALAGGIHSHSYLDLQGGKEIHRFPVGGGFYTELDIFPNRMLALVGGHDMHMHLLNLINGDIIHTFKHDERVRDVAFSNDGLNALSGCDDGSFHLWDIKPGNLIQSFWHGSRNHEWPTHTTESGLIERPKREIARVSVAFSPDGSRILTGSWTDNTMRLWDRYSRRELCSFRHNAEIVRVTFLPDGHHILSGCWDGSVHLWKLPEELTNEPIGYLYDVPPEQDNN